MINNQYELNKIIGSNIKYYRILYNKNIAKMTQEVLAEKTGLSVSTIRSLESENINHGISISSLYKISIVLNVKISDFLQRR